MIWPQVTTANSGKRKSPSSTASTPSPPHSWWTATRELFLPPEIPARPLLEQTWKEALEKRQERAINQSGAVTISFGCHGHVYSRGHASVVDAPIGLNKLETSLPEGSCKTPQFAPSRREISQILRHATAPGRPLIIPRSVRAAAPIFSRSASSLRRARHGRCPAGLNADKNVASPPSAMLPGQIDRDSHAQSQQRR